MLILCMPPRTVLREPFAYSHTLVSAPSDVTSVFLRVTDTVLPPLCQLLLQMNTNRLEVLIHFQSDGVPVMSKCQFLHFLTHTERDFWCNDKKQINTESVEGLKQSIFPTQHYIYPVLESEYSSAVSPVHLPDTVISYFADC